MVTSRQICPCCGSVVVLNGDKGACSWCKAYIWRNLDGYRDTKESSVSNQPHYTQFKIQPLDFIEANGLGYHVGNIVKYVCRYKKKNGKEDLLKARDYLDRLIKLEYPE